MMGNTSIDWVKMTDASIIKQLGAFVRHTRIQKNTTQAQLAEMAGLNRWTISQVENGGSVTLSSLIQVLRALDVLYVLNHFEVKDEISPVEYAKLKEKKRRRVRSKVNKKDKNEDLGW